MNTTTPLTLPCPQWMWDTALLAHLRDSLNRRRPRARRDSIARTWLALTRKPLHRSRVNVAQRWLRRFSTGPWYRGGSHIGRPCFGPAICFTENRRGHPGLAYLDPRR